MSILFFVCSPGRPIHVRVCQGQPQLQDSGVGRQRSTGRQGAEAVVVVIDVRIKSVGRRGHVLLCSACLLSNCVWMELPAVLSNSPSRRLTLPSPSLRCDAAASLRGQCEDFVAVPPNVCVAAVAVAMIFDGCLTCFLIAFLFPSLCSLLARWPP